MRMLKFALTLFLTAIVSIPAAAEKPNEARDMMRELGMGGLKGKKLEKAIAAAEAFSLGSKENPVRENMPQGQRAYLSKLRCANGDAPKFERGGSAGESPYGYMMDVYEVSCSDAESVSIYMDMYHDGGETRPIPGFTIVAE